MRNNTISRFPFDLFRNCSFSYFFGCDLQVKGGSLKMGEMKKGYVFCSTMFFIQYYNDTYSIYNGNIYTKNKFETTDGT